MTASTLELDRRCDHRPSAAARRRRARGDHAEGREGADHRGAGGGGARARRHLRDHQARAAVPVAGGAPMMRRDQFYASAWRPSLVGAGLAGTVHVPRAAALLRRRCCRGRRWTAVKRATQATRSRRCRGRTYAGCATTARCRRGARPRAQRRLLRPPSRPEAASGTSLRVRFPLVRGVCDGGRPVGGVLSHRALRDPDGWPSICAAYPRRTWAGRAVPVSTCSGVCRAARVTQRWCALTAPFHPTRARRRTRWAIGGLFSVALPRSP